MTTIRISRVLPPLVALVIGGVLGVGAAVATHNGDVGYAAGGVERVRVLHGSDDSDHDVDEASEEWRTLDGAELTISATQGEMILARFAARSSCEVEFTSNRCLVRILIGSVNALPGGTAAEFDDFAPGSYESHSLDAARGALPAGSYRVRVQWRVVGNASFTLDTWSLTVERAAALR